MIKKLIVTCIILMSLVSGQIASAEAILVKNYTAGNVDVNDTRLIFTMRLTRYSDGAPIKLFILPRDNAITRDFAAGYLNMPVARWWELLDSYEVSGKSNLPEVVKTEHEMYSRVSKHPNAVGYVGDYILVNTGAGDDIVAIRRLAYTK